MREINKTACIKGVVYPGGMPVYRLGALRTDTKLKFYLLLDWQNPP